MVRSLKFAWSSSPYKLQRDDGIRLRLAVTCADGLDPKIFAYRMLPTAYDQTRGFFSHVCSPVDMEDYPADNPLTGVAPEWFRLDYIDLLLRSTTEADNLLQAVKDDMRALLATLARMDTLMPTGTGLLGPDCDPPDPPDDPDPPEEPAPPTYGTVQSIEKGGTHEQNVGAGITWTNIGAGAGASPDTPDDGTNSSQVILPAGVSSSMLLIQGFDFSSIPDTAQIAGIAVRAFLRDATSGGIPDTEATGENTGSISLSDTAPRLTFLTIQSPDLGLGQNWSENTDIAGPNWTIVTRGNNTSKWGFEGIPAETVKDGAFSVGLVVQADMEPATVVVDAVYVTVYYREVV